MPTSQDFTPQGTKIEGAYENDRNAENSELYKAIIREAYADKGVKDVIVAHHIVFVCPETRYRDLGNGEKAPFQFQLIEEVPSADTLIFDHDIARKIWGEEEYRKKLVMLALEPVETRDALLKRLYEGRSK